MREKEKIHGEWIEFILNHPEFTDKDLQALKKIKQKEPNMKLEELLEKGLFSQDNEKNQATDSKLNACSEKSKAHQNQENPQETNSQGDDILIFSDNYLKELEQEAIHIIRGQFALAEKELKEYEKIVTQ